MPVRENNTVIQSPQGEESQYLDVDTLNLGTLRRCTPLSDDDVHTVIQSPQGEESPSSKSLEVEKFRSLGEFTVIQSPQGEESRFSTFREEGVTC